MFEVSGLIVEYEPDPTPCSTCRPDFLDIKFKNIRDLKFPIYKTLCDMAKIINPVKFYDDTRSKDDSCGISEEFSFDVIDDDIWFEIVGYHNAWNTFNDFDKFKELFTELLPKNKDFTITEDELRQYPVTLYKYTDNHHGVITTQKPECYHETKVVHVKKGEPAPEFEYDFEGYSDPYRYNWPYKYSLKDEIEKAYLYTNDIDCAEPFKISFYSYKHSDICGKRSIDFYQGDDSDIDNIMRIRVKVYYEDFVRIMDSIDFLDIKFDLVNDEIVIDDEDMETFRISIVNAFKDYMA